MMDGNKRAECDRCVRCFRWNFLVHDVALGIIVLILAQLVLPSLAFAALRRPSSFEPSDDDDDADGDVRSREGRHPDEAADEEIEEDDDDPKLQNIDLALLRRHLIQSLGLPESLHGMPQVTGNREDIARTIDAMNRRASESESRQRRDVYSAERGRPATRNSQGEEEVEVHNYFTHGVSTDSGSFSAQRLNFRLGNLTRILRIGQRVMTSQLISAKLHLSRPNVIDDCPTPYLYKPKSHMTSYSLVKQLPNRTLATSDGGDEQQQQEWTIDVTDTLRRWIRYNYRRTFFLLTCDTLEAGGERSPASPKARLEVRTHASTDRRDKRYVDYGIKFPFKEEPSKCNSNVKDHNCCRKSVKISMKDLQIEELVMYPKEFDFYYCKGRCKAATHPDILHALIQQYMHEHGRNKKKLPKLCCRASEVSDLSVGYFKDVPGTKLKNMTIGSWKNIIVNRCDCA